MKQLIQVYVPYTCTYHGIYCKPTFNRMREIFTRFTRASLSQIFLVSDQYLPYFCNKKKTGVDKAGRKNLSLQLSSSQVNPKIKSLRIIVCSQYLFQSIYTCGCWSVSACTGTCNILRLLFLFNQISASLQSQY